MKNIKFFFLSAMILMASSCQKEEIANASNLTENGGGG